MNTVKYIPVKTVGEKETKLQQYTLYLEETPEKSSLVRLLSKWHEAVVRKIHQPG